jgi:7-cyano-7-deazaguanine synthase
MSDSKNVLWTGGWDSTFRIIQLYKRGLILQPIYVIDHNRPSAEKEIETINILTKQITAKFINSKAKILPVKLIKRKDIPSNFYLKLIFKLIKHKRPIGKQYYWLSCLANNYNTLEQCFHKEDRGQLISVDELHEIIDETGEKNWVVNPKKIGFLRSQLFKKIRFPLIYTSKLEMKKYAEEHDFIDIMNNTWFCHKSNDKPCGKCAPCKQYIRDGFGFRLKP